jgi:phosphoglycolate phosphatase-like HAD superfamily hydrolase
MPVIILWDIDHTLVENAGVSKEIYRAAFARLAGRQPEVPVVTEGRTDRLIMRDLFADHGLPQPGWPEIEDALEAAGNEHRDALARRGYVLPGAREALMIAAGRAGWVSSVLTGNIAANAQVKLGTFGLDELLDLPVGAYGADADERSALVPVARHRIQHQRGLDPATPVVLVGDTPQDVLAARESGAAVVGVATGQHSAEQLHAAGAATVLRDLMDTDTVIALLQSHAA